MNQEPQFPAAETSPAPAASAKRGAGRGSRFFVIERNVWQRLWTLGGSTMNLVTAYLVLAAGTGADQRLSKWSARACETYAGMGKPRAAAAIARLIDAGLLERTESSTPSRPQYRFAEVERSEDPIFLPNQLVTGTGSETPILKRIRETGDELLLRLLIDLYGMVQTDATHGLPISRLASFVGEARPTKLTEQGAHALWALPPMYGEIACSTWVSSYRDAWERGDEFFYQRLELLETMGVLRYEPWVFDGEDCDEAEPLCPALPADGSEPAPELAELHDLIAECARLLGGTPPRLPFACGAQIVLPAHHRTPTLVEVARLRMEADTPGRRAAFARRKAAIARAIAAYRTLCHDLKAGRFDRPVRLG
ncbi:MAG: hypothetical protein K0S54_1054 [Alphaproteobacteria bacterium]|jgi:hypothetical protein|nr:hypothetical protein [Alphaproteobacteria bacterium]